jgi:hypothetical protein
MDELFYGSHHLETKLQQQLCKAKIYDARIEISLLK